MGTFFHSFILSFLFFSFLLSFFPSFLPFFFFFFCRKTHFNDGGAALDRAQFRIREVGQTTTQLITVNDAFSTSTLYVNHLCFPLKLATDYEVRVRVRNTAGFFSSYSSWTPVTT